MNQSQKRRLQNLYLWALWVASENERWQDRTLGPIHLLKYAYLGDLEAQRTGGEVYTEVPWRFHNFGPWDEDAFSVVETLRGVRGVKVDSYNWEGEKRYRLSVDRQLARNTERDLPLVVRLRIRRDVKRYGADTHRLLHHVYNTRPMRHTAPRKPIDMSLEPPFQAAERVSVPAPTKRQQKKLKAGVARLKALREKRKANPRRVHEFAPPVYDEVFVEGTKWLDEMVVEDWSGDIHVDPEYWEADFRREDPVDD